MIKQMKDMRNLINLVAVINVLTYIAEYRKWGQKEKASAFERKIARLDLKLKLGFLNDRKVVERVIDEKFDFIDFEKMKMKNCGESFTFVCKSKKDLIDKILKRQKTISESFLRHKDEIHSIKDPKFLEDGSDVMDLRNWNLEAFNPKSTDNKEDETFEKEVHDMIEKLGNCKKFYEDLNERDLLIDFRQVLQIIDDNGKKSPSLALAKDENHIIDQWISLKKSVRLLHETNQKLVFRIVKRAAGAPNAQTGCERANSEYNQFKDSLSNRMQLPMIKARLRIKVNGPPTSMFQPKPIRQMWLRKGHQYAETATKKKLVINRIRKEAKENYTSKIFD